MQFSGSIVEARRRAIEQLERNTEEDGRNVEEKRESCTECTEWTPARRRDDGGVHAQLLDFRRRPVGQCPNRQSPRRAENSASATAAWSAMDTNG
ncbi:hypothetical protein PF003_g8867 [Phytophthora fragariae]|nr:hypothetical protein PF003_g8867 [Phytophthora fragariae]